MFLNQSSQLQVRKHGWHSKYETSREHPRGTDSSREEPTAAERNRQQPRGTDSSREEPTAAERAARLNHWKHAFSKVLGSLDVSFARTPQRRLERTRTHVVNVSTSFLSRQMTSSERCGEQSLRHRCRGFQMSQKHQGTLVGRSQGGDALATSLTMVSLGCRVLRWSVR